MRTVLLPHRTPTLRIALYSACLDTPSSLAAARTFPSKLTRFIRSSMNHTGGTSSSLPSACSRDDGERLPRHHEQVHRRHVDCAQQVAQLLGSGDDSGIEWQD